jgi:Flp pilus assembly CpaE family ATPase
MPVYLLRSDSAPATRSAVEVGLMAIIPGLIEVSGFDRIFENKSKADAGEPATVLVVAPADDNGYLDRLIEVAAQYRNEIFLILISEEISATDYKRLVRTGGADWVSTRVGPREVAEIIARRRQLVGNPPPVSSRTAPEKQPATVSLIPSAGGVGNATIAIETATCIKTNKATRNRNVCIVDLDFQTSHVCDYLDCEARLHIEEISQTPERLDEHLFESFKTHHKSGIDLFAAPRSKFSPEALNINALDALFSMIAKRYDLILVDFPLTWFPWTSQVIAASDSAVISGINTIPNLRQIAETLRFVRASAPNLNIGVVLNRCERAILGGIARRKYVEKVLRGEKLMFLGTYTEATESINMGVPMMLGGSARRLRKDFGAVAEFCAGIRSSRAAAA